MNDLKHIIELYKTKRYKIISERMIEVDSHNVTEQIRKGRRIILCDCENDSRFANINLYRHKLFYIYYPLLKKLNQIIDEKKIAYEGAKLLKSNIKPELVLDDLESIRRLEWKKKKKIGKLK